MRQVNTDSISMTNTNTPARPNSIFRSWVWTRVLICHAEGRQCRGKLRRTKVAKCRGNSSVSTRSERSNPFRQTPLRVNKPSHQLARLTEPHSGQSLHPTQKEKPYGKYKNDYL